MLTDIENLAVCSVLQVSSLPTGLKDFDFDHIRNLYTEVKENSVDRRGERMLVLHDEISALFKKKIADAGKLTKERDEARDDHHELKRATEALVYKTIEDPAASVNTYEFKEVKALLNIY